MIDILIALGLLTFAVLSPSLLVMVIMGIKNLQEKVNDRTTR